MRQRMQLVRIIIISTLVTSLFLILTPVEAQDLLANNEVLIKNWTTSTVLVRVRNGDGPWGNSFSLPPRGELLAKDINQMDIDEGRPYIVELKNRYSIEGNEAEGFYLRLLKLR